MASKAHCLPQSYSTSCLPSSNLQNKLQSVGLDLWKFLCHTELWRTNVVFFLSLLLLCFYSVPAMGHQWVRKGITCMRQLWIWNIYKAIRVTPAMVFLFTTLGTPRWLKPEECHFMGTHSRHSLPRNSYAVRIATRSDMTELQHSGGSDDFLNPERFFLERIFSGF